MEPTCGGVHHCAFEVFYNEECYVHNILQQILSDRLLLPNIDGRKSNFNSGFKIRTNNNILFKIYYENVADIALLIIKYFKSTMMYSLMSFLCANNTKPYKESKHFYTNPRYQYLKKIK